MAAIELLSSLWGSMDVDKYWKYQKKTPLNQVGVQTQLYNASDKTIKYINIYYVPYNQVNDIVKDNFGKTAAAGQIVGPVEPDTVVVGTFEYLWTSPNIVRVEIFRIDMFFMDGSKETIMGTDLVKIVTKEVRSAVRVGDINHRNNGKIDYQHFGRYNDGSFEFDPRSYVCDYNKNSIFYMKHGAALAAKCDEHINNRYGLSKPKSKSLFGRKLW